MSNVCFFQGLAKSKRLRSRIELHLHLDGSFRLSTVWDVAKKKGMDLGFDNLSELRQAVIATRPTSLAEFLSPFQIFLPVFIGDAEALERGAYELCEDQAKEGVLYFEARYSPHGCSNTHSLNIKERVDEGSPDAFDPRQVVRAINRGLERGQRDFGIMARSILCCIRGQPQWSEDVLNLCQEFSKDGVVGIDIAGLENIKDAPSKENYVQEDADIFQKAAKLGIHRTVHAGEVGPAANVSYALTEMLAERIGHGYRVLEDPLVYGDVLSKDIHLETCPYSSLLTGAVPLSTTKKHPIIRFAEDGANFSINKDDPTIIGKTLNDEYKFLVKMGLTEGHFARANFNAARSCFLPDEEKTRLVEKLKEIYGMKF